MKLFYNIKESAEFLNISRRSIYRYIEKGIIKPHTKPQGSKYLTFDELLTLKEDLKSCNTNIQN